ncbi:MAG TPA: asparagine--tRNA ligase [Kiritimatiellia bacterium]|nr:asparagine--tRNA ligase [Kiritimatiellia bacterium]HRU71056.1 asparagine--tRNA ligase [Kiritimatiellia bacterium]
MKRTRIKAVLNGTEPGSRVTVAGWVRTRRDSKGGFSFLEINDGSCLANLQVIAPSSLDNDTDGVLRLHPGASVVVEGTLEVSEGAGQAVEVKAHAIRVLGWSAPVAYPLGKQKIGFDRLRELPHLRARTNSFGAVARMRHLLANATHRFFHDRGFLYVHTPIITSSDCEGAGAMFQVTALDLHAPPRCADGTVDYAQDFFGRRAALTVSGQLEGETYACALGDIYTFGPTFRAENSNTRRHLAEFWMIEPEMAFANLDDDAELAEAFLRHLFQAALRDGAEDLHFFDRRVLPGVLARLERLGEAPFARVTYTEAVRLLETSGRNFEFAPRWGMDMQSEHERFLAEEVFKGPVVVTDYPAEIKAFYMRRNDDGRTVAAMDVLLPEVGEIIGGSQREDRLEVLEATMRACGLNPEEYAAYLDLRRYGSVPHAGFGLGFERLVQFCTGMHNIRDVIPYPRAPRLCV